jgi:hypothetical protein
MIIIGNPVLQGTLARDLRTMIEVDLMPILYSEAGSAELGVGKDCEREVRHFIIPHDSLYRQSSPKDRQIIKANFRNFAREMVNEAKREGLNELRERTFHAARSALCPLFPFC